MKKVNCTSGPTKWVSYKSSKLENGRFGLKRFIHTVSTMWVFWGHLLLGHGSALREPYRIHHTTDDMWMFLRLLVGNGRALREPYRIHHTTDDMWMFWGCLLVMAEPLGNSTGFVTPLMICGCSEVLIGDGRALWEPYRFVTPLTICGCSEGTCWWWQSP